MKSFEILKILLEKAFEVLWTINLKSFEILRKSERESVFYWWTINLKSFEMMIALTTNILENLMNYKLEKFWNNISKTCTIWNENNEL